MSVYAVLAAGGSGSRMRADRNKIFLPVRGKSILSRSLSLFGGLIDGMVIVCREEDLSAIRETVGSLCLPFPVEYTFGGDTRQRSVLNGLNALSALPEDIVLVHDAARCQTPPSVLRNVLDSCMRYGSGVPAVPAVNTMKYADENQDVTQTIPRVGLFEIQTPQGFRYGALLEASLKAEADGFSATDDASVMEHAGAPVRLVQGSRQNIKVTEKEDLRILNAMMTEDFAGYRVGMGFDVHRLTEDRRLILCGVEIPHSLGLLGHSDADVALHALMDAMLGAASLGDIGRHYPDTSDAYKGISSLLLLKETFRKVREAGFALVNADITIIAQRPKISPYIPEMTKNICDAVQCSPDRINVKATTTEKLGFEGREEGISAQAVCLLKKDFSDFD